MLEKVHPAIALGEIEFSSGLRAVGKECLVGLILGAVTGLASAGITTLWHGNPVLGMVIFVAMVSTMAVAGLLGASVPLALKALGQDPALGAGVVVTFFITCSSRAKGLDYFVATGLRCQPSASRTSS
jgi:magnesium transporter